MNKTAQAAIAIFGAIITLAIVSVIISRKSRAPEAIQAFSSGIANVVAAAVSPGSALSNGNGNSAYASAIKQIYPVPTFGQ